MSATNERDQALSILDSNLHELSKLYKECYLSMGKGALLVYAQDVIEMRIPNKNNYRTKEDLLEVFDSPNSQASLVEMVDNYNPKNRAY